MMHLHNVCTKIRESVLEHSTLTHEHFANSSSLYSAFKLASGEDSTLQAGLSCRLILLHQLCLAIIPLLLELVRLGRHIVDCFFLVVICHCDGSFLIACRLLQDGCFPQAIADCGCLLVHLQASHLK